jgi:uncharacterized iron-regulated membrane protein
VIRKPTFLKLHRWIGLSVGLLLIVQALTGMSLVFRDEVERLIHPSLIVPVRAARPPVQALLDAVHAAHPKAKLSRAEFPKEPDQAVIVKWASKEQRWLTAVDPYDGRIVADGRDYSWPMEWLFNVHEQLLAGPVGEVIVGIEGLALIFMAVTGIVYWWPGRRRLKQGFRVKLDGSVDLRWRTLHRAVGAGVSVLLLLSAVTGVLMVWKDPLRDVLGTFTRVERRPAPKVLERPGATTIPVDRLIAQAQRTYGGAALRQLRFSSGERVVAVFLDSGSRTIRPDGTTQAYYNAYDGTDLGHYVAGSLPASSEFIDWLYTVHTGMWGGIVTKLILLLTGATLASMGASGLWLWYSRTSRKRRKTSPSRTGVQQ